MAVAGLVLSASMALAQNSSIANTTPPAAGAPVTQLSYGVSEIVQLAQAKVGDDTIIVFIRNSRNSYGLTVEQIIYLRNQGISDAVVSAMLNQPKQVVAVASPATPAPQLAAYSSAATAGSGSMATVAPVAPTVTYVQSVPDASYYYQPDYQPYYYYPDYYWYPPVSFSFGWGGGYYGGGGGHGGGYRGGYGGGGHGDVGHGGGGHR